MVSFSQSPRQQIESLSKESLCVQTAQVFLVGLSLRERYGRDEGGGPILYAVLQNYPESVQSILYADRFVMILSNLALSRRYSSWHFPHLGCVEVCVEECRGNDP
jgi:hypothetical protein